MPINRYYRGPVSDHFDGTRFFNPGHPPTDRSLGDLLRWRLLGHHAPWPSHVPGRQVVPAATFDGLRVTMVGHATVLIQAAGLNLLVDPVWAERASPLRWAGPRRVNAPGIALDRLPTIDVVLLTHNHYDHLDIHTLHALWQRDRPRVITPLGNDAVVHRTAPDVVIETADWHDRVDLGDDFVVTLEPANHWSSRRLDDRRMALWCGFVIETPAGCVYDSGDTGYGSGAIFRALKARHPPIDVAIVQIGAYAPRWFMKDQHVDPDEAVQIQIDCGATQALGVHWGTFRLTDEAREAPRDALVAALTRRQRPMDSFVALEPGDVWTKGIGIDARRTTVAA